MRMNNNDLDEQTASDGNGYGDDESTLQPPPSDMGDIDIDAIDYDDDDEEAPSAHDQLPSPEEYKAKMNGGSSSSLGSRFFGGSNSKTKIVDNNPQDGEYDNGVGIVDGNDDHDQLPSVDEYKSSVTFSNAENNNNKKSRAGLYTFLALLLVTIIVTS
jgi:hypothetical protein